MMERFNRAPAEENLEKNKQTKSDLKTKNLTIKTTIK